MYQIVCNIGVLLTLQISIALESLYVFRQCFFTKLLLMKTLIVSEFTRAYTAKDLEISVISKEIDRYSEVLQMLSTLIIDWKGSFFSYLKQKRDKVATIQDRKMDISERSLFFLYYSIDSIMNLLFSSQGIHITCCSIQNSH